jgi:hypothetical protein
MGENHLCIPYKTMRNRFAQGKKNRSFSIGYMGINQAFSKAGKN